MAKIITDKKKALSVIASEVTQKSKLAKKMTQKKVIQFFEILREDNPEPKTELYYNTPFQLLIAVLLSAQATDKGVNKATVEFFKVAPTPQAMFDLGIEGIKNYIKTIGLFNTKAANIYKTCEILIQNYQGEIPRTRDALETLPGVGRKTANVVLNTAFGELTMAVDTHIFRVSNRTGLAPGKDVLAVEQALLKVIPKVFMHNAHHWLILLGRYVCVARSPRCGACKVYDVCGYPDKTS